MSAQDIRDRLNKGDIVVVVSGTGPATRRRNARITEVMRMAARVVFVDSNKESTVRFCDLELLEKQQEKRPAPEAKKPRAAAPASAAVPQPPDAGKEATSAVPVLADSSALKRDLEAWRAMGRELEAGLRALNTELLQEARILNEEKALIDKRLDELGKELEANNADIERLRSR